MDHSNPAPATTPAKAQRVLVLQGGGALGSYQAGAFDALYRYDFEPDSVTGISIGAINAAIIAGNAPEKRIDRLKEFWEMVSSPVLWQPTSPTTKPVPSSTKAAPLWVAAFGVPGFFPPRIPPAAFWPTRKPATR